MEFNCSGLLLDADGTLVDSTAAVERTWRQWAARYGLDGDAVIKTGSGRPTEETVAEFVPTEECDRATDFVDQLELTDLDGVRAFPGALDLLDLLALLAPVAGVAGVERRPWAIVTSCSPSLLRARADAAGLPRPPVLVTAGDVSAGKPDPEGYLRAARELGLDPADCVVIEDAPAGVRAGRAAGARVIAVTTTSTVDDLEEADAVVPSLTSIHVAPSPGGIVVSTDTNVH